MAESRRCSSRCIRGERRRVAAAARSDVQPRGFHFEARELDEDDWTEGFVRVPPGE